MTFAPASVTPASNPIHCFAYEYWDRQEGRRELDQRATSINNTVVLLLASSRSAAKYKGQIVDVPLSGPGHLNTFVLSGSANYDNGRGEYVHSLNIPDAAAYYDIFAQAAVLDGSGTPKLSNPLSIMVTTP